MVIKVMKFLIIMIIKQGQDEFDSITRAYYRNNNISLIIDYNIRYRIKVFLKLTKYIYIFKCLIMFCNILIK